MRDRVAEEQHSQSAKQDFIAGAEQHRAIEEKKDEKKVIATFLIPKWLDHKLVEISKKKYGTKCKSALIRGYLIKGVKEDVKELAEQGY